MTEQPENIVAQVHAWGDMELTKAEDAEDQDKDEEK